MPASTVTSKGQITLPKEIRERLGLAAGDRVAFRESADGTIVIEPDTVEVLSLRGTVRGRRRGRRLRRLRHSRALPGGRVLVRRDARQAALGRAGVREAVSRIRPPYARLRVGR